MRDVMKFTLGAVTLLFAGAALAGPQSARRHRIFPLFSRGCLVPQCCPTPSPPVSFATHPLSLNAWQSYFPLKPGSKWVYRIAGQEVTVVVAGTEKFNNEDCHRFETRINEKASGWFELYTVRADGVYRVKVKDVQVDPPVKTLSFPATKGTTWKIDSKIADQTVTGEFKIVEDRAKVRVPAGEFEAVLVEGASVLIAGTSVSMRVWFVKEVGVVRLSYKIQESESVQELIRYEAGK
jgi:hypothetical protein